MRRRSLLEISTLNDDLQGAGDYDNIRAQREKPRTTLYLLVQVGELIIFIIILLRPLAHVCHARWADLSLEEQLHPRTADQAQVYFVGATQYVSIQEDCLRRIEIAF